MLSQVMDDLTGLPAVERPDLYKNLIESVYIKENLRAYTSLDT